MDTLTNEERQFLLKEEQRKNLHNKAQKKYRDNNKENIQNYNKTYYEEKKKKFNDIKQKLKKIDIPITIDVNEISKPEKIDRRTRDGRKKKDVINIIKPSYETRNTALALSTIEEYLNKATILHKKLKNESLKQETKAEIKKLLNDNKNINEKLILDEMTYINDNIDKTIDEIRTLYPNNNTFKSYINILVVITSHFKTINNEIYQKLSKVNIYTNKEVQNIRKENILDENDVNKIIDLNETEVLKNLNKLDDPEDRLIFGLYTLIPARRLEYRSLIITYQTQLDNLNSNNYLITTTTPKLLVLNDYKTSKTYGKQIIKIPAELDKLLNIYISLKQLKNGDYLFPLNRSKKEIRSESNFSQKVSSIFKKVYEIPISIRYLRMSWSTYINSQKISLNKKEELIKQMSHSYDESQKYFKLI